MKELCKIDISVVLCSYFGVTVMSDKEAELLTDLSATDARREKLRETLDRMRSRSNRFSDVPDFSVDVPRRTVFGNSEEELGYKATRVNLRKFKYKYSNAVYNSGKSKPLYEENTRDVKRISPDVLLMIIPQVNQSWFPQANSTHNVPVLTHILHL